MGFLGNSAGKESACTAGDPCFIPGSRRSAGEGMGYPLKYSWAFLVAPAGKESACNVGDLGLVPELGRIPGEEKSYPFQDFSLEISTDCIAHEVTKSWTGLSDFHFHSHRPTLELKQVSIQ